MLNPLTRTQAEYIWAMEQWLRCETLDMHERNLVEHLLRAARISLVDFDAMRHVAYTSFGPVLLTAVAKARQAGLLREWPKSHAQVA